MQPISFHTFLPRIDSLYNVYYPHWLMSGEFALGLLGVAAVGAVLWLARKEDKQQQQSSGEEKNTAEQNGSTAGDRIEALSPEAAREWLDDFLVEQQGDKGTSN